MIQLYELRVGCEAIRTALMLTENTRIGQKVLSLPILSLKKYFEISISEKNISLAIIYGIFVALRL